jgi:hypothetical protein
MNIARPQLGSKTVAITGEVKKRMETVLGKMAVESNAFLLAVGRVLGGIQVDNQPLFVLPL